MTLTGCSKETALEQRQAEFAYTPEKLAEEIVIRLQSAAAPAASIRSSKAVNSMTKQVEEIESDRGTDGGRPDPNSVEAIVADTAAKIQSMTTGESAGTTAQMIIDKVNLAQVSQDVKTAFSEALLAAVAEK